MNFCFTRQLVCSKTSENRGMACSSCSAELRLPLAVLEHKSLPCVLSCSEPTRRCLIPSTAQQGRAGSSAPLSCHESSSAETCAAQQNAQPGGMGMPELISPERES